jgi:hypothetical protein
MQRIRTAILLTLLPAAVLGQGGQQPDSGSGPPDIEVTELVPVRSGVSARLCSGSHNAVRVSLRTTWVGIRQVPVRLALVLPDGPPSGTLIAEGTASLTPDHRGTFTFADVEIPPRLRGRGAKLVVRANAGQEIPEQNLANDVRQLDVDRSTDWSCRG